MCVKKKFEEGKFHCCCLFLQCRDGERGNFLFRGGIGKESKTGKEIKGNIG